MNPIRMTIAIGLAMCTLAAAAAPKAPVPAVDRAAVEHRYQSERTSCLAITKADARHNCLREAGAARQDALAGKLTIAGVTPEQRRHNRLARCTVHHDASDRKACEAMALGAGSVEGSVAEGAVIRELVVQIPSEE